MVALQQLRQIVILGTAEITSYVAMTFLSATTDRNDLRVSRPRVGTEQALVLRRTDATRFIHELSAFHQTPIRTVSAVGRGP